MLRELCTSLGGHFNTNTKACIISNSTDCENIQYIKYDQENVLSPNQIQQRKDMDGFDLDCIGDCSVCILEMKPNDPGQVADMNYIQGKKKLVELGIADNSTNAIQQNTTFPDQGQNVMQNNLGQNVMAPQNVMQNNLGQNVMAPQNVMQNNLGQNVITPQNVMQNNLGQNVMAPQNVMQNNLSAQNMIMNNPNKSLQVNKMPNTVQANLFKNTDNKLSGSVNSIFQDNLDKIVNSIESKTNVLNTAAVEQEQNMMKLTQTVTNRINQANTLMQQQQQQLETSMNLEQDKLIEIPKQQESVTSQVNRLADSMIQPENTVHSLVSKSIAQMTKDRNPPVPKSNNTNLPTEYSDWGI